MDRHQQRHLAAVAKANEMRGVADDLSDEGSERPGIVFVVVRRVLARDRLGLTRARQIGGDHAELGRQAVDDARELFKPTAEAGEEQDRIALTVLLVADPDPIVFEPRHRPILRRPRAGFNGRGRDFLSQHTSHRGSGFQHHDL